MAGAQRAVTVLGAERHRHPSDRSVRWYFGEPASVGGGLASPVHQSPNDEVTTLVLDYPGRLLAELSAAVFRGGNRLELYGEDGVIIGDR